jgi:exodeoxyribonuclease V gamma subunit
MPLKIYTSNRMETLVEQLCGVVRQRLPSPFIPETIVVQSKGMQRWLAMELARHFGVWANCDYPFPNEMIERLFRAVIPDLPAAKPTSQFQPDMLTWRLMGLLPACLGKPGFEPLAGYLAGDGLKQLQLAAKIADTFDQYTVFRPDLLISWEKGADAGWQALLWRELVRDAPERIRAALLEELRLRIVRPYLDPDSLTRRISIIGFD